MQTKLSRHSGILLHISSLPSPYGIGDLGEEAYQFADFLARGGIDHWQVLPLGPTGYGNSPYACRSTFAGNELFIDLRDLVQSGYLHPKEIACHPPFPSERVNYPLVSGWKLPLLKKAAQAFITSASPEERLDYRLFTDSEQFWLDEYALYMTLSEQYKDGRWFSMWPAAYGKRNAKALDAYKKEKGPEIEIWRVLQYFFQRQWTRLRSYVNNLGIKLIGDLPIFVAEDSVDTWSNLHLFKTDEKGRFSARSGVPPDFFSATGQLWGNPVYDWNACARDGYAWWIRRIARALHYTDIIRIDHFRGFDAYWEVPDKEKTAQFGSWVQAPGEEFFAAVQAALGKIPIIAEDLGVITESVEKLRDSNGFPGMKICQFGFTLTEEGLLDSQNDFLPHNYGYNFVAYTGTHDNDTTAGWFYSLPRPLQRTVCTYLGCSPASVVWEMMRSVLASHARYAIFPMQDLLKLDSRARMNRPSTCDERNWSWRMTNKSLQKAHIAQFSALLQLYGRIPLSCP